MSKNIKRYIPKSILEFIKNRFHIFIKWDKDLSSKIISLNEPEDREAMIIICDIILRIAGSRDLEENDFIQINSTSFSSILGNKYSIYLDYLISENIVITDNWWIKGEKSISYKINFDFISDIVSIQMDNKNYINRTIREITAKTGKLKVSKIHKDNFMKDFKIDFKSAWSYLNNCFLNKIPDRKGRILDVYTNILLQRKLLEINDGQLFINRCQTNGRITSNLSILNSEFKKFILGYDISLDIKASQPTLLLMLFNLINEFNGGKEDVDNSYTYSLVYYEYKIIEKSLGKIDGARFLEKLKSVKLPSKKEIEIWKYLCEKNDIYNYLGNEIFKITGKKLTREESKMIFISTFYSSNKNNDENKKIFKSVFPTIFKFISDIKNIANIKRSHKMFPILLQGLESFIWIERILPEFERLNIKYHFIHDSVIIKKKDLERAELKINEQFFIGGINVQITKEILKSLDAL